MKNKLFKLFGNKAIDTHLAISAGRTLRWERYNVEGRTVLECFVEE